MNDTKINLEGFSLKASSIMVTDLKLNEEVLWKNIYNLLLLEQQIRFEILNQHAWNVQGLKPLEFS